MVTVPERRRGNGNDGTTNNDNNDNGSPPSSAERSESGFNLCKSAQNRSTARTFFAFAIMIVVLVVARSMFESTLSNHLYPVKNEKKQQLSESQANDHEIVIGTSIRSAPSNAKPSNSIVTDEKMTERTKPSTGITKEEEEQQEEQVIDFTVAAFAKCSTTFLLRYVLNVPQVYLGWPDQWPNNDDPKELLEIHELESNQLQTFIDRYKVTNKKRMYSDQNNQNKLQHYHRIYKGKKVVNGFKAPGLVTHTNGVRNLFKVAPKVNFIIATRHPVLYFQSFWNFRARSKNTGPLLPPPHKLIGACEKCKPEVEDCSLVTLNSFNVCTNNANFHHFLARLLFTPMNTTEELDLLGTGVRHSSYPFTGNMFIMESSQIADDDPNRLQLFRNDLERFLGVEHNVLPDIALGEKQNAVSTSSKTKMKELGIRQMNICSEEFRPLRDILLQNGASASEWIKDYLLQSPRVVVSSKDFFLESIAKWKLDPCDADTLES